MKLWQPLAKRLSGNQSVVLVLVKEARGSVPRGAGAGLVVLPSGEFYGTIGGGALEWEALSQAAKFASTGKMFEQQHVPLGPNLGQCCGGHVSLTYETWSPERLEEADFLAKAESRGCFETIITRTDAGKTGTDTDLIHRTVVKANGSERFGISAVPVAIFGAGHVGKALMRSLSLLPAQIVWADSRADMFPGLVPDNVSMHALSDPRTILSDLSSDTAIIILTHSHAQDLSILEAALKTGFSFVGVIGSKTKRARFESLLIKAGFDENLARSFHCPIGIPGIENKEPSVIAASVSAQIFMGKHLKT